MLFLVVTVIIKEMSDTKGKGKSNISGEIKGVAPLMDRLPLRLYAVIDTSGSMSWPCTENKDAGGEMVQFSRLDLVKHTLSTIITSLTEYDELCIITFNDNAEIFQSPTLLSDSQKHVIMEKVRHLEPDGKTNLWEGIRVAINTIAQRFDTDGAKLEASNTEIFVLTDGEPNINPPRPIAETMVHYIDRCIASKGYSRTVRTSTFGYGYKLDSAMLYDIAASTDGTFAFIPDASMVGTVFINSLARSLATSPTDDALSLPILLNRHAMDVADRFVDMLTEIGRAMRTGTEINPMQELEQFIQLLEYTLTELNEDLIDTDAGDGFTEQSNTAVQIREAIKFVEDMLLDCRFTENPQLGQLNKAFSPEHSTRWGKHYMFSVLSAFRNRSCINFKDKAMQHFRTRLFIKEQERIEDVFLDIKPPKPSIRLRAKNGAPAPPPPANMACFYNASGGCFSGDSLVVVSANTNQQTSAMELTTARLDGLHRGAVVLSDRGMTKVECMVKLRYTGPMYRVAPHLTLTAYHPVLLPLPPALRGAQSGETDAVSGITAFPCECGSMIDEVFDGYVYDLVLENRGIIACPPATTLTTTTDASEVELEYEQPIAINNNFIYAATFGHQCQVGKFAHEYFGTERIVSDLKNLDAAAYQQHGEITLEAYEFTRGADNRVIGIQV